MTCLVIRTLSNFDFVGLYGPGIDSRWGRDSQQPSRPTLGPIQPAIQWLQNLFPVGKAAGAWRGAEVRERVELYLCSLSGPSLPVLG